MYSKLDSKATLTEAIGSLRCRRNSSSDSVLIRQLTELHLLTRFDTVETKFSHSTGDF